METRVGFKVGRGGRQRCAAYYVVEKLDERNLVSTVLEGWTFCVGSVKNWLWLEASQGWDIGPALLIMTLLMAGAARSSRVSFSSPSSCE